MLPRREETVLLYTKLIETLLGMMALYGVMHFVSTGLGKELSLSNQLNWSWLINFRAISIKI